MVLCGPKLSLFGVIVSAWGIVQLALMGVFFKIKSVSLIEDLPLKEEYDDYQELHDDVEDGYQQVIKS